MKKKSVWIINQYASTLDVGFGGRSYFLAEELAKRGHDVNVFASNSWNLFHNQQQFKGKYHVSMTEPFRFTWFKGIKYTNSHSIKRIINWLIFSFKVLIYGLQSKEKPDVIICSVQPLFYWPVCWVLARKFKAKLITDVRDIWPLTLIKLGGFSNFHPLVMLLNIIENWSYKYSDLIISPIRYLDQHIADKGVKGKPFHFIANGFKPTNSKMKELEVKLPPSKFTVMYCGTVGLANALHTLVEAAELVKQQDICIVIIGEGGKKEDLVLKAKEKNLSNVHFMPAMPRNDVQEMMKKADALYIGALDTDLYKYGVSPNKLFEYFNAKRPVLFSINSDFQPVEEANSGIVLPPEYPLKLAEAMVELSKKTPKQREKLGKNGYEYAQEHFTYEKIADKLERLL